MNFFKNKNIWIIGGTSGIGLSIAQNLIENKSCHVIISGRDISKVDNFTAQNLSKIQLDVCSKQSFEKATRDILDKFLRIDIIIFCAGAYEPMNLENFNAINANKILETNLGSMVNFINVVIPQIIDKCTMIAVVSSVAAYFGMPNSLFYGASKAGLSNLTESLHLELKKHKINVKLISPGFVKTSLTDKNSFKMPFIISSQQAAKIIINKLPNKFFEISFPWRLIAIMKLVKLMPFGIKKLLFND